MCSVGGGSLQTEEADVIGDGVAVVVGVLNNFCDLNVFLVGIIGIKSMVSNCYS